MYAELLLASKLLSLQRLGTLQTTYLCHASPYHQQEHTCAMQCNAMLINCLAHLLPLHGNCMLMRLQHALGLLLGLLPADAVHATAA